MKKTARESADSHSEQEGPRRDQQMEEADGGQTHILDREDQQEVSRWRRQWKEG